MSFVGNIVSSLIGADASRSAANTQRDASREAIAEQQRQYDLTRGDYAPYREAGVDALGQLQKDINRPPTAEEVMSDPGYQFGLQQGQLGLDRKIAASGGRVSGAALKAASQYNTGYAASGYGAAYQRSQDRLNRLAALAGLGQTATGGSAAAGMSTANQISGITQSQGDAAGAARIARGNIWGNTTNQIAALYGRQPQTSASNWNGAFGGFGSNGLGTSGPVGGTADDPWYG